MSKNNWYYTKEEIEKNSPSRVHGIDSKQESFQRWSYSTFLQDLGQRLHNPQKTIATSIVICQRFYTRQSLAKNDAKTISMVCMFLAGKLEESPRPVDEVVLVAYQVLYRIKPPRELFERLKVTVLTGEKLVMSTLNFDLEIEHPYKPFMDWVKTRVKTERDVQVLSQAVLNFVNDGLRTSLCLQFRPRQIAAAAIYLGSSFTKVNVDDGVNIWWKEFDVTTRELCCICDQILDLYQQHFLVPVMRDDRKLKDGETNKGSVVKEADKSRNLLLK